jgi:hypothetical protein
MKSRITIAAVLTAGCALAQGNPPLPGRGRMGFGGPPEPGARFVGAEAGMPGRVVKNAPYSADLVTETVQALADGNHIRQTSSAKVYRDGEGRTRREQSVNLNGLGSNNNMPQLVFINDPVSGMNYALNAKDHSGTRTVLKPGGGRMGMGKNGAPRESSGAEGRGRGRGALEADLNLKVESLGRQTMEGVAVEGRRVTATIPAGDVGNDQAIQIVTETWFSPDLQTMVFAKRSDPRAGETVTRLTNISRSEPSRTLFDPPADFKIVESEGRMPRPRSQSTDLQK